MGKVTNQALSELAIYALSGILVVAIVVSGVAVFFAIKEAPEVASKALKDYFNGGNALKILTVFAVLITSAFLALAGQLSEGSIALLSSISGYILGTIQGEKIQIKPEVISKNNTHESQK